MKIEEIDAMPAGREMDCLIAQTIFQLIVRQGKDDDWPDWYSGTQPGKEPTWGDSEIVAHYSTYIPAAWLIIEKFRSLGWNGGVRFEKGFYEALAGMKSKPGWFAIARAETAPLTICRLALKLAQFITK